MRGSAVDSIVLKHAGWRSRAKSNFCSGTVLGVPLRDLVQSSSRKSKRKGLPSLITYFPVCTRLPHPFLFLLYLCAIFNLPLRLIETRNCFKKKHSRKRLIHNIPPFSLHKSVSIYLYSSLIFMSPFFLSPSTIKT
ncbi:MAG: hypothetical protein JOS17DRAFT_767101 [Linnemannia elongata]|nr:MAG: hypothetical protein JOS17DRAFT_767101 [Linnemannia elongata]